MDHRYLLRSQIGTSRVIEETAKFVALSEQIGRRKRRRLVKSCMLKKVQKNLAHLNDLSKEESPVWPFMTLSPHCTGNKINVFSKTDNLVNLQKCYKTKSPKEEEINGVFLEQKELPDCVLHTPVQTLEQKNMNLHTNLNAGQIHYRSITSEQCQDYNLAQGNNAKEVYVHRRNRDHLQQEGWVFDKFSPVMAKPKWKAPLSVPHTPICGRICVPATPQTPKANCLPFLSELTPLLGNCSSNLMLSQSDEVLATPRCEAYLYSEIPTGEKLRTPLFPNAQNSGIIDFNIPLTPCLPNLNCLQGILATPKVLSKVESGVPDLIQLLDNERESMDVMDDHLAHFDKNGGNGHSPVSFNPDMGCTFTKLCDMHVPSNQQSNNDLHVLRAKQHGKGRHCKRMSTDLEKIVRKEQKVRERERRQERKSSFEKPQKENSYSISRKIACGRRTRSLVKAVINCGMASSDQQINLIFQPTHVDVEEE